MRMLLAVSIVLFAGSAPAESEFNKLWAMCEESHPEAVLDCVEAELQKTRPPLPVTHPMESAEMEAMSRAECRGFVHPDTGQVTPEWCLKRKKLHRKVFLQTYLTKRDAEVLRSLRACLIRSGGVATDDGQIDDSRVDWPAAVDCAEAVG